MPFYVEWWEYLWKRDTLQNNDGPANVSLSEPFNFCSDIFQIALREEHRFEQLHGSPCTFAKCLDKVWWREPGIPICRFVADTETRVKHWVAWDEVVDGPANQVDRPGSRSNENFLSDEKRTKSPCYNCISSYEMILNERGKSLFSNVCRWWLLRSWK